MKKGIWRLVLGVKVILVASALLGCQSSTIEPAASDVPAYDDGYGCIYGYVYNAITDEDVGDATVTWSGGPYSLGSTATSPTGYYQIDANLSWLQYEGEFFDGIAEHPGFETGYNSIDGYTFGQSYRRDFYLYPE